MGAIATTSRIALRVLPVLATWLAVASTQPITDETGQPFTIDRDQSAYHSGDVLGVEQILSPANFSQHWDKRYVTVEAWLCYVATATPHYSNLPGLEADWDVHFGLVDTLPPNHQAVTQTYRKTHALTCEITPECRLVGTNSLMAIHNGSATTYRKVRVKGYLRLGTESGHEGAMSYTYGNSQTLSSGHWEIHPVESVETIDTKPHFTLGPNAVYATVPPADRFKLTWTTWKTVSSTNYGALNGKVLALRQAADGSGDVEIDIKDTATTKKTTVVVPQYYIFAFDSMTNTLFFRSSLGVYSQDSIKAGDVAKFSGLRSWRFTGSTPQLTPVMQPVEKIG